jgi:hypothetical protein
LGCAVAPPPALAASLNAYAALIIWYVLKCWLQVLEQLQLLQDQVALTYGEARAAAKEQQERQQQHWPDFGQNVQCGDALVNSNGSNSGQCLQGMSQLAGGQTIEMSWQAGSSAAGSACVQYSSNGSGGSSSEDTGSDMLSAFVAELRGAADDEGAAAAAAAALSEMREWVAQQDMRMVEVRQPGAVHGLRVHTVVLIPLDGRAAAGRGTGN